MADRLGHSVHRGAINQEKISKGADRTSEQLDRKAKPIPTEEESLSAERNKTLDSLRKKHAGPDGKLSSGELKAFDAEARTLFSDKVIGGQAELIGLLRNRPDSSKGDIELAIVRNAPHFREISEYVDHKYGGKNVLRHSLNKAGVTDSRLREALEEGRRLKHLDQQTLGALGLLPDKEPTQRRTATQPAPGISLRPGAPELDFGATPPQEILYRVQYRTFERTFSAGELRALFTNDSKELESAQKFELKKMQLLLQEHLRKDLSGKYNYAELPEPQRSEYAAFRRNQERERAELAKLQERQAEEMTARR